MKTAIKQRLPRAVEFWLALSYARVRRARGVLCGLAPLPVSKVASCMRWEDALLYVEFSPRSIRKRIRAHSNHYWRQTRRGLLFRAGWEREIEEVPPDSLHPTVHHIFGRGRDYHDTHQYRVMSKAVHLYLSGATDRRPPYGCRSHADVDRYFAELAMSFQSIQTMGYRTQPQLLKGRSGAVRRINDELLVAIDSEGELVLIELSGNHRFGIARYLGLPRIPGLLVGVDEGFFLDNAPKGGRGIKGFVDAIETCGRVWRFGGA